MANKRLLLLRHATSLSSSPSDKTRKLAPKGLEDAIVLGKLMAEKKNIPDIILCSPAIRTRQTLDGLQKHLHTPDAKFIDILYSGSTGDYLYEIQKINDEYDTILMVAHNPSIYELVILLAAQGDDSLMQKLSEGYSPASLSVIECKGKSWADIQPAENELVNLVNPMDYNDSGRPTRWM